MSYHGNFICTQIFSHSGVVLCWRLPGGKSAPGGAFPGWHKGCVLLHCQILSFWHFLFVPGLCDFILSSGNSHVGSIWAVEMFAGELQDLESMLNVENVLTLTQLYDLWAALEIHSIFQVS